MAEVKGHCDPQFKEVQSLLQDFIASGAECGAAITVNLHGKDVIDIWGGYKDESRKEAWEKDTLVNVWSTTKTITSLAILMAIDRGLFDVNTKVSQVWPEFAANGKEDVEMRMIMSHTSGLSGWEEKIQPSDVFDLPKSTALLAAQAPWWTPGTASGYHANTMGHLLGEVIRRTTNKSLKQFVADEIATPLAADFQIGCLERDWPRTSNVIPQPPGGFDITSLPPDSLAYRTLTNPPLPAATANSPDWRRAEIGATNGHGTARAVNKIMSTITLGGEVDGVRLLHPKTIDLIFHEQARGPDLVVGIPLRFGTGFGLPGAGTDVEGWIPNEGRICFWGGWGGSVIIMDLDRGLTICYVMNKMGEGVLGNDRSKEYVKAVYRALGVILPEAPSKL